MNKEQKQLKTNMIFEYFDIHSHLNLGELKENQDEVISEMAKEKIGTITVGIDLETSKEAIALAKKYKNIWAAVGFHPMNIFKEEFNKESYKNLILENEIVAIGECGLDYSKLKDNDLRTKERQKEVFTKQVELAVEFNKPLMIHCRPKENTMDAYFDALEILNSFSEPRLKGNIHFFVGDTNIAQRFLNIGFTLSFTGVVTFSKDYDQIIEYLPLNMILPETDAPFVTPVPYRGQCNKPQYIKEIVKRIAEIRNRDVEEVKQIFIKNTLRVFDSIKSDLT